MFFSHSLDGPEQVVSVAHNPISFTLRRITIILPEAGRQFNCASDYTTTPSLLMALISAVV